ncbi:hypothetical protein CDL15_Pgr011563 [Punica granatum]|uniref:HAT C-terminal dimerisation domain-containing protein n=1 Tax=Punica granatum TaxID=22663 RepID=A0A218Y0J3_PUNGR|nr:hypothetical protein CDL15_Pgr011563 [Punica granatum]
MNFKDNLNVKIGLYNCLDWIVLDPNERLKIDKQLDVFHKARGLFGRESVKNARTEKEPTDWWESYRD